MSLKFHLYINTAMMGNGWGGGQETERREKRCGMVCQQPTQIIANQILFTAKSFSMVGWDCITPKNTCLVTYTLKSLLHTYTHTHTPWPIQSRMCEHVFTVDILWSKRSGYTFCGLENNFSLREEQDAGKNTQILRFHMWFLKCWTLLDREGKIFIYVSKSRKYCRQN